MEPAGFFDGFRLQRLVASSLIGWLDAHSGALTALATVVLVLITAAYVVVTYWLVREQRSQGAAPQVACEWSSRVGHGNADLKLTNVGGGTALDLTIVRGPGGCVDVEMSELGWGTSLLVGREIVWPIKPKVDGEEFPVGRVSLTMSYFDYKWQRAYFQVICIPFDLDQGRTVVGNVGTLSLDWSTRALRQMAARALPYWKRSAFRRRTRGKSLTKLLVDDDLRDALREKLEAAVAEVRELRDKVTPYEEQF